MQFYQQQLCIWFIIKQKMSERRSWTPQQDQILKMLREGHKIQKWTKIRQLMNSQFGIGERTDKQIRQRYENHLKEGIVKTTWSSKEQSTLIELHLVYGNRWVFIGQKIKQIGCLRPGNSIKNYFLSLMKRALRNFNKYLSFIGKTKEFRPLPLSFIRKFLKKSNQSFNNSDDPKKQIFQEIQQRLLEFSEIKSALEARKEELLKKTQDLYEIIGTIQTSRNRRKGKEANLRKKQFLKAQNQRYIKLNNYQDKMPFQLKSDSEKRETMPENQNIYEEASAFSHAQSPLDENLFSIRPKNYKQKSQQKENMIFEEREWQLRNSVPLSFLDISEFFKA